MKTDKNIDLEGTEIVFIEMALSRLITVETQMLESSGFFWQMKLVVKFFR